MNRAALIRQYAAQGAVARVAAIEAELAALRAAFPELRGGASAARSTTNGTGPSHTRAAAAAAPTGPPKARRGHRMTPAQRKAVSVRMAAYWRKRREREARRHARAVAGGKATAAKRRAQAAAKGGDA